MEIESYASIKDKYVSKFVWKNIVCRFIIPWAIITDTEPQFDSAIFLTFYLELNIKNVLNTLLSTK